MNLNELEKAVYSAVAIAVFVVASIIVMSIVTDVKISMAVKKECLIERK